MSNNQQDDFVVFVIAILVGLVAVGVWKFSQTFDLDVQTSMSVLGRLAPFSIAWVLIWKFSPFGFYMTWPVALATLWTAWWPALDYWALHSATSAAATDIYGLSAHVAEVVTPWYAEWYTKFGGVVGSIGLGYTANSKLFQRY